MLDEDLECARAVGDASLVETARACPSADPSHLHPIARTNMRSVGSVPGSLVEMSDSLVVRGAREHNLKNVGIELPRDRLIVFTGLSGLGQVVAGLRHDLRRGPAALRRVPLVVRPPVPGPDGQARRRLHRGPVAGHLDRPEVGLAQPALHRRHHHRGLRLPPAALRPDRRAPLPECGAPITRQTPQQIVDRILELPEGTRFQVLAPVVRGRKGTYETLLADLAAQGYARARIDGEVHELTRQGRPGALRAAHHRGDRRSARGPRRSSSAGSPTRSRPRCASPTASPRSQLVPRREAGGATTARPTTR